MEQFYDLLTYSFKSVSTIIFACVAGALLVRFKVLNDEHLKFLSKIVFIVMLPCLLFTKVAGNDKLGELLKTSWILPLSCVFYIILGCGLGFIAAKLCRPKKEFFNGVVAASGFANSGYMPIPMVIVVTAIFPCFINQKNSAIIGVSYVSAYLLAFSPLAWSLGYSLVAGRKVKEIKLSHLLPPPVIAILSGLIIGLLPGREILCKPEGFLFSIFGAAELVAAGTIPCALIVLGGKLSHGPVRGIVNKRTIFSVIMIKLIILPIIGIAYVSSLRKFGLIPMDSLLALVLILEAAVPPATNLVLMCALEHKNEKEMATLLFWLYISSIPTITIFIIISMWLFG